MIPPILGAQPTLCRNGATTTVAADGSAVLTRGATFTIQASRQPMKPDERAQLLSEGQRTRRAFKVYAAANQTVLATVNEHTAVPASQMMIDGQWFDVHQRDPYASQLGNITTSPDFLSHYRYVVVGEDRPDCPS